MSRLACELSTLAKDNGYDKQVVDLALDHIHDNEVARAYDRGERLQKRIELAVWWGRQLVGAQRGEEVVLHHQAIGAKKKPKGNRSSAGYSS